MSRDKAGAAGPFFGLVLILSLPFFHALDATGAALPFVPALPISAVMVCVPMGAALLLVGHHNELAAAGGVFKSGFSFRGIANAWWMVVAVGTMPTAFALTGGMVWLSGAALPALRPAPASAIIIAAALFFLGAVAEEIGWQGYAYPRLTLRYSPLQAGLIIGVVWALWHVIPFAQMGRSAGWIIWHGAAMVLMRLIIVWLYENAGHSILIGPLLLRIAARCSLHVWGGQSSAKCIIGRITWHTRSKKALWRPALLCLDFPFCT